MKKLALNFLIVVLLCIATMVVLEGIYALAQWDKSRGTITYQTYLRLAGNEELPPWNDETHLSDSSEPDGAPFTRLLTREAIERLIPKLKVAAVGLGNSPYIELKQEAAEINTH